MSLTKLIDDLTDNETNLRSAMQSGNLGAIESATEAFQATLLQLKAIRPNSGDREARQKLAALKPQLDQSRALAALLADMTGQMRDLATSRTHDTHPALYARNGERFA